MADAFDVNDRTTWAWINGGEVTAAWVRPPDDNLAIHPEQRDAYYQIADGVPYAAPSPPGLVFNPMKGVNDWPSTFSEEEVYGWAVSQGLVTDQR